MAFGMLVGAVTPELAGAFLFGWCATVVIYRKCAQEYVSPFEFAMAVGIGLFGLGLTWTDFSQTSPSIRVFAILSAGVGSYLVRSVNICGPSAIALQDRLGLKGRTVVVTGVNEGGIGFDTALDFARSGARVIIACRSETRGQQARELLAQESKNPKVFFEQLDLSSLRSVVSCAKEINTKFGTVDILVNNAGMMTPTRSVTEDKYEMTFQVNCLATFLFTILLLPSLSNSKREGTEWTGPRVVFVNSSVHKAVGTMGGVDLTNVNLENNYGLFKAYCQSKFMLLALANELSRRLRSKQLDQELLDVVAKHTGSSLLAKDLDHITVNSIMPGTIRTTITRNMPYWAQLGHHYIILLLNKNLEEGSRTTLYVATSKKLNCITGQYFEHCSIAPCAREAHDQKLTGQIWLWINQQLAAATQFDSTS